MKQLIDSNDGTKIRFNTYQVFEAIDNSPVDELGRAI